MERVVLNKYNLHWPFQGDGWLRMRLFSLTGTEETMRQRTPSLLLCEALVLQKSCQYARGCLAIRQLTIDTETSRSFRSVSKKIM